MEALRAPAAGQPRKARKRPVCPLDRTTALLFPSSTQCVQASGPRKRDWFGGCRCRPPPPNAHCGRGLSQSRPRGNAVVCAHPRAPGESSTQSDFPFRLFFWVRLESRSGGAHDAGRARIRSSFLIYQGFTSRRMAKNGTEEAFSCHNRRTIASRRPQWCHARQYRMETAPRQQPPGAPLAGALRAHAKPIPPWSRNNAEAR
jgi:hypothetical protein